MRADLVSGPCESPVSYAEAAEHLRLIDDSDQGYVERVLRASTNMAESFTNRAIMSQTWAVTWDRLPAKNIITLPFGRLQTVNSVKYRDSAGDSITVLSENYEVDNAGTVGRIQIDSSHRMWCVANKLNVFSVTFSCGWPTVNAVPEDIKQAILMMSSHLYEHREDVVDIGANSGGSTPVQMPQASSWLLSPYRIYSF